MKKLLYIFILFTILTNSLLANQKTVKTEKDVENFIKNMSLQSQKILGDKNLSEKQKGQKYEEFSAKIVDTEWVARFILGKTWRTIEKEQQDRFIKLYTEYILTNYMPKLKDYNKDIVAKKVTKQREGVFLATCQTQDAKNRVINVDFRIIERKGELYITDIIPEGISFIGNQRADVSSSISRLGFDGFLNELESKLK